MGDRNPLVKSYIPDNEIHVEIFQFGARIGGNLVAFLERVGQLFHFLFIQLGGILENELTRVGSN